MLSPTQDLLDTYCIPAFMGPVSSNHFLMQRVRPRERDKERKRNCPCAGRSRGHFERSCGTFDATSIRLSSTGAETVRYPFCCCPVVISSPTVPLITRSARPADAKALQRLNVVASVQGTHFPSSRWYSRLKGAPDESVGVHAVGSHLPGGQWGAPFGCYHSGK